MNRRMTSGGLIRLAGVLLASAVASATASAAPAYDVRVLVDISGSMKQNDPQNLRRPALRLLADLLPPDARAGVWTFGKFVNLQVPLGMVDEYWRKQAAAGIDKVHSRGAFTNIEMAIDKGLTGWGQPADGTRRSLILLTDGVVDVSKDPLDSLRSRERILAEQLPLLQGSGAAVHTVALSERADHKLLQLLSEATGGWYEMASDAAQLQRIFLHLFEKAAPADTLPLDDNRFRVDGSIEEMTLLVFTPPGAEPVKLDPPEGEAWGEPLAPPSVSWRSGDGYALITVKQPAVGEWRIVGEVDPDNRVMVVTDLKLTVEELPNSVVPGQSLTLRAELLKEGERITQQGFLELVDMSLMQQLPDGGSERRLVPDDGSGADEQGFDGLFTVTVPETSTEGDHSLALNVDGGSFKRSFRHRFSVRWPVDLRHEAIEGAAGRYRVSLRPRPESLRPDSLSVAAELLAPDGQAQPIAFGAAADGWLAAETAELNQAGDYQLRLRIAGEDGFGKPLSLPLPTLALAGTGEAPPPVAAEAPAESIDGSAPNWWLIGGVVVLVNLLLIGAGLFIWRRARKRQVELLEEPEDAEDAAETAGAHAPTPAVKAEPASEDEPRAEPEEIAEAVVPDESAEIDDSLVDGGEDPVDASDAVDDAAEELIEENEPAPAAEDEPAPEARAAEPPLVDDDGLDDVFGDIDELDELADDVALFETDDDSDESPLDDELPKAQEG